MVEVRRQADFIIQRYATGMWPLVRGQRPFIVAGLSFSRYVIPGSPGRYEYKFTRAFIADLTTVGEGDLAIDVVSELLLQERILDALWVDGLTSSASRDSRRKLAMEEVRHQILPHGAQTLAQSVVETLSGMGTSEGVHSYVATDQLPIVRMEM